MMFRRSLLALALPVLSLVVAGCNPPIDEAGKGGAAPAGDVKGATPTHEPAPADTKKPEMTPTPEAGVMPAPGEKPAEKPAEAPKGEEMPK